MWQLSLVSFCIAFEGESVKVEQSLLFVFSQVFLQHLSPLLSLPTFAALWLTILDFMDKYMHAGSSDLLVRMVVTLTHSIYVNTASK